MYVKRNWGEGKTRVRNVAYYNNTKYGVDVLDQMARANSVRGRTEDSQWWSSMTSST